MCESLPRTSYIKAVDYWFLLALAVPFIEVLVQVYLDKTRGEDQQNQPGKNRSKRLNKLGLSTVPGSGPIWFG